MSSSPSRRRTLALLAVIAAALGAGSAMLRSAPCGGGASREAPGQEPIGAPGAGAGAALPLYRSPSAKGGDIVIDSSSPAYDGLKVATALRKTSREIFERESRTEPWATRHEKFFAKVIARDLSTLAPSVKLESVECRTQSCLVNVVALEADGNTALMALQLGRYSARAGVDAASDEDLGDGTMRTPFHMVFSAEQRDRDLETYRQRLEATRRTTLQQAKDDPEYSAELRKYGIKIPGL